MKWYNGPMHPSIFLQFSSVHAQASSVAGSEVRRRRRRVKVAAPDAAEDSAAVHQHGDSAAGVASSSDAGLSQGAGAAASSEAPAPPPAIQSSSDPALHAGTGIRSHGRPVIASSRVSALVEDTDVVGEILSTSQSGGRFLTGAVESGDSVLKRSVFKEMPLDGPLHVDLTASPCHIHPCCAGVFKQLSESETGRRPALDLDAAAVSVQCTPGEPRVCLFGVSFFPFNAIPSLLFVVMFLFNSIPPLPVVLRKHILRG